MKVKIVVLTLLALVFQAQARLVVESEASCAARAWARTALKAGGSVGSASVTALKTDAGETFYASRLAGGGTVFLAGDTTRRPVIAYVASFTNAADAASIDRASPLWALLNADQGQAAVKLAAAEKAAANGGKTAAERAWDELLADGDAQTPLRASASVATSLGSLSDVRVAALVKSKWNQSTVGNKRCYNYYTPVLSSGTHAVCGCVATAMSQLMRYHKFPSASVNSVTRTCYVQASTLSITDAKRDLTTQAGTYDWSSMPLEPTSSISDAQCKAIGKLTSDAGISVYMQYDTNAQGGSGAFMANSSVALREVFGYASACYYSANEVSANQTVVRNAMLSNFDAGYPVLLGITGSVGGHAIVGDGYGYSGTTLYVHLNMGWSGQDDAWYNLPDIGSFSAVDELIFNIFPKATAGLATLSGRVVDDEGNAADGVSVEIRASGEDDVVARDTTVNGVWGVRVPAGRTYDVSVTSADKKMTETKTGVRVASTASVSSSFIGWINSSSYVTYPYAYVTSVGNLQDTEDIVLFQATARIGEDHLYSSLDKAIADAKTLYDAAPTPKTPVKVEVIADSTLETSVTVDFPLVLTATNSDYVVTRVKDAKISVATNGTLAVSAIAFEPSAAVLVDVAAKGVVEVGAGVDFGVDADVAAVRTQDAKGFVLAGEPKAWFSVDCVAARAVDEVFGSAKGDLATVTEWARKFVNLSDVNRELAGAPVDEGASPYALKWALLPVPLEDALAYYVVDGAPETTNCYRRLDRLFELFEKNVSTPATVTVVKSGSLSRKVTPKSDLKIVSTTGAVVSNLTADAGFVVNDGVCLGVSGLSFDGAGSAKLNALFLVDGGELSLGGVMAIRNVKGATATHSGVIAVERGLATLGADFGRVTIENCENTMKNSKGGAVSLAGEDCYLQLQSRVAITGCNARSCGGAIYADVGAGIDLSGYLTITGNTTRATKDLADNIYCDQDDGDAMTLVVTGPIETGSRIGLSFYGYDISDVGGEFAGVDASFADKALIADSAKAFYLEDDATLIAQPSKTYATLVWAEEQTGVKAVDQAIAVAHVVGGLYYASLEDAFSVVPKGGTIELLRDTTLSSNIVVSGSITLRSAAGQAYAVTRAAECALTVPSGASLALADITFDGRLDEERGGSGPLFLVNEGSLTLGAGTLVRDVTGGVERAGAIKVYKGKLEMLSGAEIRDCVNVWPDKSSEKGRGGAITADFSSTVTLSGGRIVDCEANEGDAVFVANASTLNVSGDFTAAGVFVASGSSLVLADPLTSAVGDIVVEPDDTYETSSAAFGSVATTFAGTDAQRADSAHVFTNAETLDIGFAVRNGSKTLLVWSDAIDASGRYVDENGVVYTIVPGGTSLQATLPTAAAGLVYTGAEQVGVAAGIGFTLVGGSATDAGSYTASATLKPGFVWNDAASATVRDIAWSIARATLAVVADAKSKVAGESDPELTYSVTGFVGADTRQTVLTGSLARTAGETAGVYAIEQGSLAVIGNNYEIAFTGASFTISEPSPGPGPGPGPTPVEIQPIAFTSIEKIGEEWVLVATNATEGCEYSLRSGTTLETNTWAETAWTPWTGATGPITNRVPAAASEPQRFWLILGRPTSTPE